MFLVNPQILESSLRKACSNIVAAEPDLTKWDSIMGDGDCGETFAAGCSALVSALDRGLASSGSLLSLTSHIASITETRMGGTLGAILSIYFNALTAELARPPYEITAAPARACEVLMGHTMAREGHRTIMDVLIPATRALREKAGMREMVEAAMRGAEGTRTLTPLLGRATYVGGMEGKELPPDPGAWGAMEIIKGLWEGMGEGGGANGSA